MIYSFELETEINLKRVNVYKLEQKDYLDQNKDIRILSKKILIEIYVK